MGCTRQYVEADLTYRSQIAATIEASYPSLAKQNAASLLFFKGGEEKQLTEFASSVSRPCSLRPTLSPVPGYMLETRGGEG